MARPASATGQPSREGWARRDGWSTNSSLDWRFVSSNTRWTRSGPRTSTRRRPAASALTAAPRIRRRPLESRNDTCRRSIRMTEGSSASALRIRASISSAEAMSTSPSRKTSAGLVPGGLSVPAPLNHDHGRVTRPSGRLPGGGTAHRSLGSGHLRIARRGHAAPRPVFPEFGQEPADDDHRPCGGQKDRVGEDGSSPIPSSGARKPSEFRPCTERVPLRSAWRAYHW